MPRSVREKNQNREQRKGKKDLPFRPGQERAEGRAQAAQELRSREGGKKLTQVLVQQGGESPVESECGMKMGIQRARKGIRRVFLGSGGAGVEMLPLHHLVSWTGHSSKNPVPGALSCANVQEPEKGLREARRAPRYVNES